MNSRLPDFIVIGAQRCGTSSLWRTLCEHPALVPATPHKEVHYYDNNYAKGRAWYESRWPARKDGKVHFEATPSYIFRDRVPERVARDIPHAKFVLLLRNPVDRAWSQYWVYQAVYGGMKVLFNPSHETVRRGVYVQGLKQWHRYFLREQILVLKSEDFFAHPTAIVDEVLDFLALPSNVMPKGVHVYDPLEHQKFRYGTRAIPDKIKAHLTKYYAPHNAELYDYLHRDFKW